MIDANSLWASLPLPALLLASDDKVVACNTAAETFLNMSAKAICGQVVWDAVKIAPALDGAFARARAQQSALFVNDVAVGSHERVPAQCNIQIAPLQGQSDQMIMLLSPREMTSRLSGTDVTAKAAKSAIGMAEMLSHEIKNPLAGITGAAQLLSMELAPKDQELTDLIVAESRRIVQLLDQVEQFGNMVPPQPRVVNLHDILNRARTSASVGFGAHMQFIEDYDPSLPSTFADPDQLLQVVLNLIKNASEANPAGGTITLKSFYDPSLRVRTADGVVARLPLQIEVIDDGPGLDASIARDVFEPFVSGHSNGRGLGLALVSKLIGQAGALINVDSTPGHCAFRISLPRAAHEQEVD